MVMMNGYSMCGNNQFTSNNRLNWILLGLDWHPQDNWPPEFSPWETFSWRKRSKRQGDTTARKASKVKTHTTNAKKLRRGSFKFHSEIAEYIREYRAMRIQFISEYRSCACHEPYTLKDVEAAYETLQRFPGQRITLTRKKKIPENNENGVNSTVHRNEQCQEQQTKKSNEEKILFDMSKCDSAGISTKVDCFVDQYIGRHFLGLKTQSQTDVARQEHCPVVEIIIPEDHVVTRISSVTPSSQSSIKLPHCNSESSIPLVRRSSAFSHGTSSSMGSGYSRISTSSNVTNPSTMGVCDICPFPRSVCTPKAPLLSNDKNNIMKQVSKWKESEKPDLNEKRAIPWKTLKYLGYNPSMRRYLHEIYTPVGRNRLRTPLSLSSKKCFPTANEAIIKNNEDQDRQNTILSSAMAKTTIFKKDSNSFPHFQSSRRTFLIDRPVNQYTGERKPKLAIISACQTVVI
ncbi:uncharacterized protein LOC120346568 [Styela clava]